MPNERIVIFHVDEHGCARRWTDNGALVRCGECKNGRQGHGIPNGRVLCAKPFMGDTVAGAMHDNDWYCADGVKTEVQE